MAEAETTEDGPTAQDLIEKEEEVVSEEAKKYFVLVAARRYEDICSFEIMDGEVYVEINGNHVNEDFLRWAYREAGYVAACTGYDKELDQMGVSFVPE